MELQFLPFSFSIDCNIDLYTNARLERIIVEKEMALLFLLFQLFLHISKYLKIFLYYIIIRIIINYNNLITRSSPSSFHNISISPQKLHLFNFKLFNYSKTNSSLASLIVSSTGESATPHHIQTGRPPKADEIRCGVKRDPCTRV